MLTDSAGLAVVASEQQPMVAPLLAVASEQQPMVALLLAEASGPLHQIPVAAVPAAVHQQRWRMTVCQQRR